MAKAFNILASDEWFVGEDKTIVIDVLQADESTPQAMTGWALTWELMDSADGPVLLTKTTALSEITISTGADTNDRATITVLDTDTEGIGPGWYYHRLRRTDAGLELRLSYGDALLRGSTPA